jgi:transposase InsO family protein
MGECVTASQIAAALGTSRRAVNLRATKEGWVYAQTEGSARARAYRVLGLPADIQVALTLRQGAAIAPLAANSDELAPESLAATLWKNKPDKQREIAKHRMTLVAAVRRAVELGRPKLEAISHVAEETGTAPATLRRWVATANEAREGEALFALAPRYVGRTAMAECSPPAWDYFLADYLRNGEPKAEEVYDRLKSAAAERGWTIPSLSTLRRRLAREISPTAVTLARKGREAAERAALPPQKRDRSIFTAMEALNADGHRFDVFVEWEGRRLRVVVVVVQDLYSGKILAHRIGEVESAELVRLALGDVIDAYGIPRKIWLDSGRGFASKMITGRMKTRYRFKIRHEEPEGILTGLGIEVHWTTPYHGQAKPIERAFRDLCGHIARHPLFEGAYTGNNPVNKPANYGGRAIPFAEFEKIVASEIARHNARLGRRSDVCAGVHSFDQVFGESYAKAVVRKASAEHRQLLMLAAEGVTADSTDASIRFMGGRYWTDSIALQRLAGRKIVVRYDPQRLDQPLQVYTLDGRHICAAPMLEAVPFESADHGKAWMRERQRLVKAAKTELEAQLRMDAIAAGKLVPLGKPAAVPAPAATAGMFKAALKPQRAPMAVGMSREEADAAFAEAMALRRKQASQELE